jgi:hypothetical protein
MPKYWKRGILLLVFLPIALVLLYVFAAGPLIYLDETHDLDKTKIGRALRAMYFPVRVVAETDSKVARMLLGYENWWIERARESRKRQNEAK